MKKILLASVGVIAISVGTVYAACIPTPSCSSLGYESSSSCEGGIKCPFGEAWNCTLADKITEIEECCTGGKEDTSNCEVGSIFYSDWTCSSGSLTPGKTPIGVVVYTDRKGHGQAMALNSLGDYEWATEYIDLSLNNFETDQAASTDLKSYENTTVITAAGTSSIYPAAWAAKHYKTAGTDARDWCLPAAGILTNIKNNMSIINSGFSLAGGTQIEGSFPLWSSSEISHDRAWFSGFDGDYGMGSGNDYRSYYKQLKRDVRPVLEF